MTSVPGANPFSTPSSLPYELPDFAAVHLEHFREAFDAGMAEQAAEIDAITGASEPPTFDNTVAALERSGRTLDRATRVFSMLTSSDTTPELQALEVEYAPRFAAFADARLLDRELFARLDAVHDHRHELGLDAEAVRLVERYHLDFVRAGAALDQQDQDRLREINAELAELSTRFGLNLLADTNAAALHLRDVAELDGLSADAVDAAAAAAAARGLDGYLLTLVLPTHQPALERLHDRAVRRRLWEASVSRGSRGDEHDNSEVVLALVRLRAERAALLGYRTHSDYVLADRTAGSNERLDAMLEQLVAPSVRMAAAGARRAGGGAAGRHRGGGLRRLGLVLLRRPAQARALLVRHRGPAALVRGRARPRRRGVPRRRRALRDQLHPPRRPARPPPRLPRVRGG